MSKSDMHDQATTRVGRPVVLIIGSLNAQKYLDGNLVLTAIYGGNTPLRVKANNLADELLEPESTEPEDRVRLFDRFSSVSADRMSIFIKSDIFYQTVYDDLMAGVEAEPSEVRVIVAEIGYLTEGSPVIEVIRRYFPDAAVFTIDDLGSLPQPYDINAGQ